MATPAVGYVRVSSEEQAASGLGLAAQRSAIELEAQRRGWNLVGILGDGGASGKAMDGRPGLSEALRRLKEGEAEILIVAKLDRLSRSVKDFAHLLDLSARQQWALVALDLGVDTSTATGEAMAYIVGTFSQMERRLIGQRTKEALQQARMRGTKLGAPVSVSPETEQQIVSRRMEGATLNQIAAELNEAGVAAPKSDRGWQHPTIRHILSRHDVPTFPRGRRKGLPKSES